ncbi:hypothetical protein SISNIDRAFT_541482 [Sistotremastrum niveocremeum HHB9708]|uniref:Uncharacterized protein n=1 Tax=Sistotremastrum niveocremeum HHB9708 TaxID=1314777 RepID=A0A164MI37_9AGAM|nr:hypothetical protein SISNIDRAFT_541482 [Sistotremastrum niveocremeum HHB9708]
MAPSPFKSHAERGLINLDPSLDSQATLRRLLERDYKEHHFYHNPVGLHNHLSHHLVAAYDLGADSETLVEIYGKEEIIQRPLDLTKIGIDVDGLPAIGEVNESNWTTWLGEERAYGAYLKFFEGVVGRVGVREAVLRYIFADEVNGLERMMLCRTLGALMHSMIQLGAGLEFSDPLMVVQGRATHYIGFFLPETLRGPNIYHPQSISLPSRTSSLSLFGIIQKIYDSPILEPVYPYKSYDDYPKRFDDILEEGKGRGGELQRIVNLWDLDFDADGEDGDRDGRIEEVVEECFWVCVCVVFATSRRGRKPRLDFYTMHFVTAAIFLPTFVDLEKRRRYVVDYLRMWLYLVGIWFIDRGRPRIDVSVVMEYSASPQPPPLPHSSSNGACNGTSYNTDIGNEEDIWAAMARDVVHAPDAHTPKTVRTLLYAHRKYGGRKAGEVPGIWKNSLANSNLDEAGGGEKGELWMEGLDKLDGSLFVRCAGVLMDCMGWVTRGERAGVWDRSGLGWEEAWD